MDNELKVLNYLSNKVSIPGPQWNFMTDLSPKALQSRKWWDGIIGEQTKQQNIAKDCYRTQIYIDESDIKANSTENKEKTKTLEGFQAHLRQHIPENAPEHAINMMSTLVQQGLESYVNREIVVKWCTLMHQEIEAGATSKMVVITPEKMLRYNTKTSTIELELQWLAKDGEAMKEEICKTIYIFDPVNQTMQLKVENKNSQIHTKEFEIICKGLMPKDSFYFSQEFDLKGLTLIAAINNNNRSEIINLLKNENVEKTINAIKDQLSPAARTMVNEKNFVGNLTKDIETVK